MNPIISLFFPTSGYSLIKTEEMEQFPQLPMDIVKILLSILKLSEISNLTLSCKQWSEYTGHYLKLLKDEAIRLSKHLDNGTYIPASKCSGNRVTVKVPCWLSGNTFKVCRRSSQDPEFFFITTLFEVHFTDDDACFKSWKAFFCLRSCESYCSNDLRAITNIEFIQNLDHQQKEHIYRVVSALNKIVRRKNDF